MEFKHSVTLLNYHVILLYTNGRGLKREKKGNWPLKYVEYMSLESLDFC